MRNYGGQICFLGGKSDETDRDEIETAYREAQEEAGLDVTRLTLLAKMCPIYTTNIGQDSFLLTPVVVFYDKENNPTMNLNKNEVEALFEIETEKFLLKDNYEVASTHIKNQEFHFHYFNQLIPERDLQIWGITSIIAVIISSHLHSHSPQFELDPDVRLDPSNVNQYLYDFVLDKSKNLIDHFINKKF
jgi:coenzyme A diphosphatase NUDT7